MQRLMLCLIGLLMTVSLCSADIAPDPRPEPKPKPTPKKVVKQRLLTGQPTFVEISDADRPAVLELPESLIQTLTSGSPRSDASPRLQTIVAGLAMSAAVVSVGLMFARRKGRYAPSILVLGGLTIGASVVLGNRAPPVLGDEIPVRPPTTTLTSKGVETSVEVHVVGENQPIVLRIDRDTLQKLLDKE